MQETHLKNLYGAWADIEDYLKEKGYIKEDQTSYEIIIPDLAGKWFISNKNNIFNIKHVGN